MRLSVYYSTLLYYGETYSHPSGIFHNHSFVQRVCNQFWRQTIITSKQDRHFCLLCFWWNGYQCRLIGTKTRVLILDLKLPIFIQEVSGIKSEVFVNAPKFSFKKGKKKNPIIPEIVSKWIWNKRRKRTK